jgi:hypothetical protein
VSAYYASSIPFAFWQIENPEAQQSPSRKKIVPVIKHLIPHGKYIVAVVNALHTSTVFFAGCRQCCRRDNYTQFA